MIDFLPTSEGDFEWWENVVEVAQEADNLIYKTPANALGFFFIYHGEKSAT